MGAPAPRCVKCRPRISRERVQRRRWSARLRLHVFCARATGRPHDKFNPHLDGDSRSGIMSSCNNHNGSNLNAASHCTRPPELPVGYQVVRAVLCRAGLRVRCACAHAPRRNPPIHRTMAGPQLQRGLHTVLVRRDSAG